MESMSKTSGTTAEAAMLPESCHHFSTHCIKHDRDGPRGGPNLTPLHNLSFLFITLSTDDCFCYYNRCVLVATWFICIYVYNTVVWLRDMIINQYLVAMQCVLYIFVKLGKNKIHTHFCHYAIICTLQVVGWVPHGRKTAAAFFLTNVLRHLFPDQSIQPHPGPSLSPYHVCNMSQQNTRGRVMLPPGTHTYTHRSPPPPTPSTLEVLLDR